MRQAISPRLAMRTVVNIGERCGPRSAHCACAGALAFASGGAVNGLSWTGPAPAGAPAGAAGCGEANVPPGDQTGSTGPAGGGGAAAACAGGFFVCLRACFDAAAGADEAA